jgi:hypothetical protein
MFFLGQRSLVPLLLLGPTFFPLFFSCPFNRDDRHLLALAMSSDFSVSKGANVELLVNSFREKNYSNYNRLCKNNDDFIEPFSLFYEIVSD